MVQDIFSGIVVVDMTKFFSGPIATRYLADMGAEVIKLESEAHYDPTRNLPPVKNGVSGYFEMLNRNKSSVTIDLKTDSGLGKFYTLIKEADIFVENMTPSVKKRLKIGYKDLKKYNKKIIYASLCGVDQTSEKKYFDVIAQAESGLISLSGSPGEPMKIGPAVIDAYSGTNLAFALASCLYYREKNGIGSQITVSMLSSSMNLLEHNLVEYSIQGKDPLPAGDMDNAISPFGIFKTGDGKIVLAIATKKHWRHFVDEFDQKGILKDQRFTNNDLRLKNNDELQKKIENIFSEETSKEVLKRLNRRQIPASLINNMSDIANNPWFFRSNSLLKIDHPKLGEIIVPGISFKIDDSSEIRYEPAPNLGQNNQEYGLQD